MSDSDGPPTLPHHTHCCSIGDPFVQGGWEMDKGSPRGVQGPRRPSPLPPPARTSGDAEAFPSVPPGWPQPPGQ